MWVWTPSILWACLFTQLTQLGLGFLGEKHMNDLDIESSFPLLHFVFVCFCGFYNRMEEESTGN